MEDENLNIVKYLRLSESMVNQIEDFRATTRPIIDFSEAVRELIRLGLKAAAPE